MPTVKNHQNVITRTRVYFVTLLFFIKLAKSRSPLLPTIMDNPDMVAHIEGDIAILYCSVLNLGDNTVTWRKLPSSSPLTIGSRSWVRDLRVHAEHVPYSTQWNLVIEQVRMEDSGVYECQVNKRKLQIRHKVTLTVKAKPVSLLPRIEISGKNVLKAGSLLQLTCVALLVDVSMETVTWTKDGESLFQDKDNRCSLHTSATMSGQNTGIVRSRLEIKDTRSDDSGVYLCRSSERAQMAGVKVDIQGRFEGAMKVDPLTFNLKLIVHTITKEPTFKKWISQKEALNFLNLPTTKWPMIHSRAAYVSCV